MRDQVEIAEILKKNGYKLTNQRKSIIKVLLEHQNQLLSAEQIFEKSKDKCSGTNFSTIYRNLEILESAEIIHKMVMDGISKYAIVCDQDHHHHHIICKDCGKTEVIDFCPLHEVSKRVRDKQFTLIEHKFELYGYCKQCEKQKEKRK